MNPVYVNPSVPGSSCFDHWTRSLKHASLRHWPPATSHPTIKRCSETKLISCLETKGTEENIYPQKVPGLPQGHVMGSPGSWCLLGLTEMGDWSGHGTWRRSRQWRGAEMETMKGHGINPISKFLHKSGTGQETLTGWCAIIITSSLCALQWDTEPAPGSLAHMHSITSTATCSPCQEGFYPKIFRSQKIFSVIFTQFQHKLSPEKQRKYIHISRGHVK